MVELYSLCMHQIDEIACHDQLYAMDLHIFALMVLICVLHDYSGQMRR